MMQRATSSSPFLLFYAPQPTLLIMALISQIITVFAIGKLKVPLMAPNGLHIHERTGSTVDSFQQNNLNISSFVSFIRIVSLGGQEDSLEGTVCVTLEW